MYSQPDVLPAAPRVTEQQRLTATLVLSTLVHGLLILGVGFAVSDNAPLVPTLDVIFSQTSTPLTPKQADFLAQANQQGGGDHDKAQRPRDAQAGIVPQLQDGLAPVPLQAQSAAAPPPPQARIITSTQGKDPVATAQTQPLPDRPDANAPMNAREQRDAAMARLAAEVHLRSEVTKVYRDGNLLGNANVTTTSWHYDDTTALANGTYQYTARAFDAAGNQGSQSGQAPLVVATYLPAPSVTINDALLSLADATATVTF